MTKLAATSAARKTEGVIASTVELSLDNGAPKSVLLLPFGKHYGRDGRGPYILDRGDHAAQVIAATQAVAGSADLMFDYDHQSFHAPRVGGQAKAAGWIAPASLRQGEEGIYGDVAWTPPADAALNAREYRYHSPYFRVDKASRRITRLVNAGLTNSPNLDLPALAAEEPDASPEEGTPMTIKIATLLSSAALAGLAVTADSSDDDVLAAIDQLVTDKTGTEAALASVQQKLGLGDDADTEAVLAAVDNAQKGAAPDPTKFVPIAALKDVNDRLAQIEEEKVLAAIDGAIEGGKLPPAQKDWATELGKKDFASLRTYLDTAPAFNGGETVKGDAPVEKGKLTQEERVICAQQGLTEAEFLAARDDEGNI